MPGGWTKSLKVTDIRLTFDDAMFGTFISCVRPPPTRDVRMSDVGLVAYEKGVPGIQTSIPVKNVIDA